MYFSFGLRERKEKKSKYFAPTGYLTLKCPKVNGSDGQKDQHFIRLWCLVASGGLHICVSSTSFQKNDMSWPQQPLTEKVQKFNMIFHDSSQIFFFKI